MNTKQLVLCADPLALTLLKEPGAMGADIAVGNTQRFGVPVGYEDHMPPIWRQRMPINAICHRILGISIDSRGNKNVACASNAGTTYPAEKATSNVCTAQALLAVMMSFYAVFHDPRG